MFRKLLTKWSVENPNVTGEEILDGLKINFPEFKTKNLSSRRTLSIQMRRPLVELAILRRGKSIFVKRSIPLFWDLVTFGLIEILPVGRKDQEKVFRFLKQNYSLSEK